MENLIYEINAVSTYIESFKTVSTGYLSFFSEKASIEKEYGNKSQVDYIDWFCEFAKQVFVKLKDTGSFVIDLGGAYQKGEPAYSLYQFKTLIKLCDDIGFHLAQPFYWHNPSALPAPIEWVNKRKLRAKTSGEEVRRRFLPPFPRA